MFKKVSLSLGIIIGIITLLAMGYKYDGRLAKAEDVNKSIQSISIRLEQKIQSDRLSNIQQRIWQYEDRYGTDCSKMPNNVRSEYRNLLKDKDAVKHELQVLIK